ncbi:MAG: hypothetical protein REJ23_11850 [Brevundimonas sp.]|nr:hypothetical protein [Brevundimonas sp.]
MISLIVAALLAVPMPDSLSGSSDAEIERDFRCFAGATAAVGSGEMDEPEARYVVGMAIYYLGGLDALQPDTDWIAKADNLTDAEADALIPGIEQDCWRRFSDQNHRLASLFGDALPTGQH